MTGTTAQDKHFTGAARMICFARKEAIFRYTKNIQRNFLGLLRKKVNDR